MAQAFVGRLRFLDESGAHLGMTRRYGRAAPGQRVCESTPGTSGTHYTMVATLGLTGISAPLIFKGAMNRVVFEGYVQQMLLPTLRPRDILIMDNLSAHKGESIRATIEACGARVVYLPPYSPDLNPIEQCWAKVKEALRAAKARNFDALVDALGQALRSITHSDFLAWLNHCGYAINA